LTNRPREGTLGDPAVTGAAMGAGQEPR
jgi:hypothetical protein